MFSAWQGGWEGKMGLSYFKMFQIQNQQCIYIISTIHSINSFVTEKYFKSIIYVATYLYVIDIMENENELNIKLE